MKRPGGRTAQLSTYERPSESKLVGQAIDFDHRQRLQPRTQDSALLSYGPADFVQLVEHGLAC